MPADYRRGMEVLLTEGLEAEKMRYTLILKDKQVKETQLEGEAERVAHARGRQAAALLRVLDHAHEPRGVVSQTTAAAALFTGAVARAWVAGAWVAGAWVALDDQGDDCGGGQ